MRIRILNTTYRLVDGNMVRISDSGPEEIFASIKEVVTHLKYQYQVLSNEQKREIMHMAVDHFYKD
jgi:hypothetical protein